MSEDRRERALKLALAGLLHDIGKVALRAGDTGASRTWDAEAKQDYGRLHALLSHDVVAMLVPPTLGGEEIRHWAGQHHRPSQREHYIVRLADRLSSGERTETEKEDEPATQPKQLLSIFSVIQADGEDNPHSLYWPLRPLDLNDGATAEQWFPADEWDSKRVAQAYGKLWGDFKDQALTLKQAHSNGGDLETYLETLLLLMQRYFWSVPSAYYRSLPDISLYDHSRMTAALAAVLAGTDLSDEQLMALAQAPESQDTEVALLVGGDLSGVQDFIYTITSRGATSALRGRSFYLQLLTEATARYILRRLDLPITNLVYVGGGNFYLLARASDKTALEEIRRDLSHILYTHHRGDLYMAVACLALPARDFFAGRISARWQELGERLQAAKQRRFSELAPKDLLSLFAPQGHGGNEETECQVCGREYEDVEVYEPGVRKCKACLAFEKEVGDPLRKACYLVWDFEPTLLTPPTSLALRDRSSPWSEVLRSMGLHVHIEQALNGLHPPKGRRLVLALDEASLKSVRPASNVAVGRRFLVNVSPIVKREDVQGFGEAYKKQTGQELQEGSIKPFALMEMQAEGIKRLGVLRMDVDNLGHLFSQGLGQKATLSRVAALSFAIGLYFEGWVGVLAQRRNREHGDCVYAIYSGGDDLFFVGAWDQVVELAMDIRRDLTPYAAGHPGVHASAGVVLISGKYPLAQGARDAGQAEERAKSLKWWDEEGNVHKKDAICFLGRALPWSRFGYLLQESVSFETAYDTRVFLEGLLKDKSANRAFVRLLIRLDERYQEEIEKRRRAGKDLGANRRPQAFWGPWNWLFEYYLARMERMYQKEQLLQNLRTLRSEMRATFHQRIEWVGLAARWAELKTRK